MFHSNLSLNFPTPSSSVLPYKYILLTEASWGTNVSTLISTMAASFADNTVIMATSMRNKYKRVYLCNIQVVS